MRRRSIVLGLAAGLLAATPVLATQASAAAPSGSSVRSAAATVPSFGHVFVIVGENKSIDQLNSSNAPYIMNTLKPEGAWFTDYNDETKGSLADYIALTSGQYAACEPMGPCGQQAVPSIFSQLGTANWKDWNESMPSNCYKHYTGSNDDLNAYKPGHNPAPWYAGIPCSTDDVPAGTTGPNDMSYLNNALSAGTVPEYNFITPNLCQDSYHSCNGANIVTEYDNFLKQEVPLIESSPEFGSNGIIFITYDEGYEPTADPNTMLIALGPQVQAGTYTGEYDHYSTLETVEAGLGLPCLANSCNSGVLPIFGTQTSSPVVQISNPVANSTVSGTVTVSGTATDTGSAISQVQVSVDGGTPVTATGTGSWSAQVDTTSLTNGTHVLTATATDGNGNTGTGTENLHVSNSGTTTACPTPSSGATELSGNVSVESNQDGWTGVYNADSVVTRVEPSGGSYDGSWALQVSPKSGDSGTAGLSNAKPYWVTSTTAGDEYDASVFVRPSTAGEKVALVLREETPGGAKIGSQTTSVTINGTSWRQVNASYTAKDSGDVLHYTVYSTNLASSSQNFLADCLQLQSP